jgi:hypothetical protein
MDKLFLIIITHVININVSQLKTYIGLDSLSAGSEISFFDAQFTEKGIYYGTYKDNILIVSNKKALQFYYKDASTFEKTISTLAPNIEVTALTLDDANNFYGYSLIKDGVRQRVKAGTDTEVFVDEGKPIPEEEALLKANLISGNELETMKAKHGEAYTNKQIGYEVGKRVAIKLLTHFFGNNMDEVAENLNKVLLIEYK